MNITENDIDEVREIFKNLVQEAKDSNLIQWNDGLNFSDFIYALWRLFNNHENFKESTSKILSMVPKDTAIDILAQEIKGIKINYK